MDCGVMQTQQRIYSPMAAGNGAYIVHSVLARNVSGYTLESIPTNKTLFPPLLKSYRKLASIVHTVPEYGDVLFPPESKSVITFHNFFWDISYRQYCSLTHRLFYQFLQFDFVTQAVDRADAIVAVSEYTASLVRQTFPEAKLKVIHNGVDITRFTPRKQTESKVVNILFSGNPSRRKGRDMLRAVAQRLPENVFLLVTGGLRSIGENLKHSKIKYLGQVPYASMPALYQQADILLLPSYREGLSLSAMEAMSSGLPIVCYDTSSMRELIVAQKGGYLSAPDNLTELMNNLNKLINSVYEREQFGAFNRARCEALFSEERMVAQYQRLFDGLL